MIKRTNELVYVKRLYIFPYKGFLDKEYHKFGYKKCEIKKKGKFFNTVFYVRHKERQKGLYDLLYLINLPLSYYRTLVMPALLVIFVVSFFLDGLGYSVGLLLQALILLISCATMLVSTFLSTWGYVAYHKNDTNGKLDRALASRGWDVWTSYKDNDPRFDPPSSIGFALMSKSSPASKASSSKSKAAPARNNDDENIVTLLTANGEEIDFMEVAGIAYKGKFYAIMQPTELLEGMDDNEALVFEAKRSPDGSDSFEIVLDDEIIDAVFDEYNRLYNQANGK